MTRTQDLMISGISWLVASTYSSREPPKSFGWPLICRRPILLRRGVLVMGFMVLLSSGVPDNSDCRMYSCLASSLAMRVVPNRYSRNFWKRWTQDSHTGWRFISIESLLYLRRCVKGKQECFSVQHISFLTFVNVLKAIILFLYVY